jgi:TolA-binding protein
MERLNGDLQSLVEAERGEAEPTAQELEDVRRALLGRVGAAALAGAAASTLAKSAAGAGAGAATGVAAASAGVGLSVKFGVTALVLGGLAAFAVPEWTSPAPPSKPSVVEPAPAPPATATAPSVIAPVRSSPEEPPITPADERVVRAKPQVAPAPSADRNAPPLAEEVRLLKDAQQAVKAGRPAVAIAALAEHQRRFPHGQLALERSAVRINALCALGQIAEARRAAAAFLEHHASSGLAEQVRASCAGGGTPGR